MGIGTISALSSVPAFSSAVVFSVEKKLEVSAAEQAQQVGSTRYGTMYEVKTNPSHP